MTNEELEAIRARAEAALQYERSSWSAEEGMYVSPAESKDSEDMTCPLCNGNGDVEGQRYDDKGKHAATVVAYGIGEGLRLAEEWVENGPRDTLALLAEVERLKSAVDSMRDARRLLNQMRDHVSDQACDELLSILSDEPLDAEGNLYLTAAEAAFNRGVQAGREQVISYLGLQATVFTLNVEQMGQTIRTMKFPENVP